MRGEQSPGTLVRDEATGREGVLMYVGEWADPERLPFCMRTVAFVRPVGGGREWITSPEQLSRSVPASEVEAAK